MASLPAYHLCECSANLRTNCSESVVSPLLRWIFSSSVTRRVAPEWAVLQSGIAPLSTVAKFAFERLRQVTLPILLLASTVCPAAISFVQQNNAVPATPQSSVSVTYTAAQAAGDTNVVAVGWNDSTSSTTSVTDSQGNVYTLTIGPTRQSGVHSQAIYVAKNVVAAAANANTVTISFNTAAPYPDVRILSYRGLDTVSPVEARRWCGGHGHDNQFWTSDQDECYWFAVRRCLRKHTRQRCWNLERVLPAA